MRVKMRQKIVPFIIFSVLFLVSCSKAPSDSIIQTAIANTQAAYTPTVVILDTPTPIPTPTEFYTPTPIPLEDINLKSILVAQDKMPQGYFGTRTATEVKNLDAPKPLKLFWQQLEREDELAGRYLLLLYESKLDVKSAYEMQLFRDNPLVETQAIDGIGENAEIARSTFMGQKVAQLVFYRCYVTVKIVMDDMKQDNEIFIFAEQLDKNIQATICR
jgi:hypothetical protein